MQPHRLRPRFEIQLPIRGEQALNLLQQQLDLSNCPCVGEIMKVQQHFQLGIPKAERKFWSPVLSGHLEQPEDVGSTLHGLIGPNPNLWTAVAFSYIAFGTGILFLLTLGGVQLFLGNSAWAFWVALALAFLMMVAWILSQVAQKLAAAQTAGLRHFLEATFQLDALEQQRTDQDPYHD